MGRSRWTAVWVIALASCSSKPPQTTSPPGPPVGPAAATDAGSVPPATGSPLCERGECSSTAPLYPTQGCPDGVHVGGRGPCARFADGTCGWAALVCAAAGAAPCGGQDCALPVPSAWTCADGSIGEFLCVRDRGGRCGATYRPCPPISAPVVVAPPPPPPPPPSPHPCSPLPADRALMGWPIGSICQLGGGPDQPDRTVVKSLPDGTEIIEQLGRCQRVREVECHTKCLPPDARIATPAGDVPVADVRVGLEVWTQDARGVRVAAPVEQVVRTTIHGAHHVVHLVLSDGRSLVVSPEHPTLSGQVQALDVGDTYDGAMILTLELVRYTGAATYDILPSGTGIYWADGVPLRSTLVGLAPAR